LRITRAIAARLGLDYAALLTQARATGRRVAPSVVLPGEPVLGQVERGPGWWSGTLNDWRPSSKNLKTRGVRAWNRARRRDDAAIALWADHPDGPPPATAKRRVTLVVERRRRAGRLPDAINLMESTADALVANGLLVGDSGRWLSFGEPDVRVNPEIAWAWQTTIRLENVSCLKKS
jgi:hypothetical protein